MVAGVNSSTSTVGAGALCAWASALALRSMPSMSCSRTGSEKARKRELKLDLVGDDVVPGPAVDRAHGDHGWLDRLDLAADDRLEIENGERRQDDRIDSAVWPGAMTAFAAEGHGERRRACQERACTVKDGSRGLVRVAVQRQGEVWLGESAVQTVGEHAPSPADGFLGRLADQENRAAPPVFMLSEPPGRADEAGHVHVVAAGVHHADLTALRVSCFDFARVGKPRLLDHGERVHVGTNKHNGPPPVLDQPHDAEFPHAGRHLAPARLSSVASRAAVSTSR